MNQCWFSCQDTYVKEISFLEAGKAGADGPEGEHPDPELAPFCVSPAHSKRHQIDPLAHFFFKRPDLQECFHVLPQEGILKVYIIDLDDVSIATKRLGYKL